MLTKVNGKEEAKVILAEIQNTVVSHSGKLFSFGTAVIVIGILLSVFQQFVGINVVLYYAPEIFKNMGSGTDTALLQTIIVGTVNLLFTVLAIMTVDKIRKEAAHDDRGFRHGNLHVCAWALLFSPKRLVCRHSSLCWFM
ncbi:MAG: MFS transporter [Flavobacteriaceae bacterium]|nr:MFS transporter [Flavobacteriaceae bacterium]